LTDRRVVTSALTPGVPKVGSWQDATVLDIRTETARVKTFRLALAVPGAHMAGQHYLVRLTAPDGYTAQRSYSVASPPSDTGEIELTIERLPDGEVSTFLHDETNVGDTIEVRGPIGGWFVWNGHGPALLVGGGSGVVPLMAMLRLARARSNQQVAHLVVSVRTPDDLIYADEVQGPDTTVVYTRETAPGSARAAGRLTRDDLAPRVRADATTFVCGSSRFAEAASDLLIEAGVPVDSIRIERFGPTG
jgi:ferredoxin-NADP reductase